MKTINTYDELNIPTSYKEFVKYFLSNLSRIDDVMRVILFGSCARGIADESSSDVDLLVITKHDVALDDEFFIMSECTPSFDHDFYVPSDIIINSEDKYNKYKNTFGMVQKQAEREGVDISGLLQ